MITKQEIDSQLRAIDIDGRGWGRAEIKELRSLIVPGETIHFCINGYYKSGFAMLCITDRRVLLVDKKPFYLTVEDINYDMIANVVFDGRYFVATLQVCTHSTTLSFSCIGRNAMRDACSYLQQQVLESKRENWLYHSSANPFGYIVSPEVPQEQLGRIYDTNFVAPTTVQPVGSPSSQGLRQTTGINQASQPKPSSVMSFGYRATNPYMRAPIMFRRRLHKVI